MVAPPSLEAQSPNFLKVNIILILLAVIRCYGLFLEVGMARVHMMGQGLSQKVL
jgi:hypothetical protein